MSMALPWLEAMGSISGESTPAGSGAGKPVRFAALYMANGALMDSWTPKGVGADFELSPTLSPLGGFKGDLLVLSNLWNRAANFGDGHYVKTGAWLTGTAITRTTGSNLCAGNLSVDQAMARKVGNLTPLPSLELGIEPPSTGVDVNVGFTRLYGAHIAYSPDFGVYPVDPAVARVVAEAVRSFEEAGATVDLVDIHLPYDHLELADLWCRMITSLNLGTIAGLREQGIDLLGEHRNTMPPEYARRVERGFEVGILDLHRDQVMRTTVHHTIQAVLDRYDFPIGRAHV